MTEPWSEEAWWRSLLEDASATMAACPGLVGEQLRKHRRTWDGRCTRCSPRSWPCTVAGVALHAAAHAPTW